MKEIYGIEELGEARSAPVVIHYATIRPWTRPKQIGGLSKIWWQHAEKSHCWAEIKQKFLSALSAAEKQYVSELMKEELQLAAAPTPVTAKVKPAAKSYPNADMKDPAACARWLAAKNSPNWEEIRVKHLLPLPLKEKINILRFLQTAEAA